MTTPSQDRKRCSRCGKNKPFSEFYRLASNRKWKDGLHSDCKACAKKRTRARYVAKRDEILAQGREYMDTKRARVKDAVFAAYGGYVCACCGEPERKFLSIDHVNNDGAAFRRMVNGKRTSAGYHTYNWLLKHGFPPGFQVLCMNCNHGKRMNGGVCPHQVRRNDQPKGVEASASKCSAPLRLIPKGEEMVSSHVESVSSRKAESA